jgi:hypothetical protein
MEEKKKYCANHEGVEVAEGSILLCDTCLDNIYTERRPHYKPDGKGGVTRA